MARQTPLFARANARSFPRRHLVGAGQRTLLTTPKSACPSTNPRRLSLSNSKTQLTTIAYGHRSNVPRAQPHSKIITARHDQPCRAVAGARSIGLLRRLAPRGNTFFSSMIFLLFADATVRGHRSNTARSDTSVSEALGDDPIIHDAGTAGTIGRVD